MVGVHQLGGTAVEAGFLQDGDPGSADRGTRGAQEPVDQGIKDLRIRNQGFEDQGNKDQGMKHQGLRDLWIRGEGAEDQGIKDQGIQDRGPRDQHQGTMGMRIRA